MTFIMPTSRRNFIVKSSLLSGLMLSSALPTRAETNKKPVESKKETVYLWEKGSKNDLPTEESERPKLEIYLPQQAATNRRCVVVCPGGGYYGIAEDHEGKQVAELFNGHGIVAALLFYRHRTHQHPAPYADACRAMRIMRNNATTYQIDPNKIAIMGFSAGGHLASTVSTQPDLYKDPLDDLVAKVSARPDRVILGYPVISLGEFAHIGSRDNLLGKNADPALVKQLSNHLQVTAQTPPAFLFHTADDAGVPVQNSLLFAEACVRHKVPVELHVFPKGKHGVGLAQNDAHLKIWPQNLLNWLDQWA
ncbi:alpha/beta hydrolase [Rhodocytophaga rosea]|uniref:Alpha/beta hydrolase n=1 Tax=Rhodocytophaga rosea TaxID=2704465 RepID=A0A6C0GU30_9BACT|nr:alpha/beta hydrolase [Rhodocytophaga rosea]QHT71427.1 alpha/beta hydrolase [Rhodocytophaga rosea]